jgi:hypothetical protein
MKEIVDPRPGEIFRIAIAVTGEDNIATDMKAELSAVAPKQIQYAHEIAEVLTSIAEEFRNLHITMARSKN